MKCKLLSIAVLLGAGVAAYGQSAEVAPSGAQAFAPENAILNTAIPFSVGAREAQQNLRGSFGWATFQEGLVKGIYFRFDPDGYARFSPSPRLDTDVFEVICRPRSYACMARKGPMSLTITPTGQVQVKLDEATASDEFFLNDGFAELQVPPRVLGTLDAQLETLLSSGGTLIARRNGTDVEEVHLSGFPVVTAFLRWVSARQDYAVLASDWPIPDAGGANPSTLTQPASWLAPNRAAPVPVTPGQTTLQDDTRTEPEAAVEPMSLESLQAELAHIKEMLGALANNDVSLTDTLENRAAAQDTVAPKPASLPGIDPLITSFNPTFEEASVSVGADHLQYLTQVMGLSLETASMIVELHQQETAAQATTETETSCACPGFRIAADLPLGLAPQTHATTKAHDMAAAFKPLTQYFQLIRE